MPRRAASPSDSEGSNNSAPVRPAYKKFSIQDYNTNNQPLNESHGTKLNNLKLQWASSVRDLNAALAALTDAAEELAEAYADEGESDEWHGVMEGLEKRAKEIIDRSRHAELYGQALNELRQKLARGEEVDDAPTELQTRFEELQADYKSLSQRKRYGKHKGYIDFRSKIWNIFTPESNMPAVTALLPADEGDEAGSDDEEVEMGAATLVVKCPITMNIMWEPMTNKICHHSYSREGLNDYLRRGPAECPVSGCRNRIQWSNCVPDQTLKKRIKRYQANKDRQHTAQQGRANVVDSEEEDEEEEGSAVSQSLQGTQAD